MESNVIKKTCDFEYYHDYTPTAEVLDSHKHLLLANVAILWKLICSDQSTPITHHGERYITIDRNELLSYIALYNNTIIYYTLYCCITILLYM